MKDKNEADQEKRNKRKIAEVLHQKACEGPVEVSPEMADEMGCFEETAMTPEELAGEEPFGDGVFTGDPDDNAQKG